MPPSILESSEIECLLSMIPSLMVDLIYIVIKSLLNLDSSYPLPTPSIR